MLQVLVYAGRCILVGCDLVAVWAGWKLLVGGLCDGLCRWLVLGFLADGLSG